MKTKSNFAWITLAILFLTFLFCFPFIIPDNKVAIEESYLQQQSYKDINLLYIYKSKEIPFWAFHFGGGYPFIKHPENISLSPLFYLLIVPFGSSNGFKLFLFFSYFMGIVGFFAFANKVLKCNVTISAATTMLFIFNSFIPFQVNTGNLREHGWFYLPFICYFLTASKRNIRYTFYGAILISLLILNGFNLTLLPFSFFLFLYVTLNFLPFPTENISENKKIFRNLVLMFVIAFLLSAVKLFPIIELLKHNMRGIEQYAVASANSMTFVKLAKALLFKGPYAVGTGNNGLGMGSVMWIGVIPLVLFFLSCIFRFKKVYKYLIIIVFFIILCMARNFPVDVFYILWHLPLFHSVGETARYFSFPIVFMIPVVIGIFFSGKYFTKLNKKYKILVYIIMFVAAGNMFFTNKTYYEHTDNYQVKEPQIKTESDFFNVFMSEPESFGNIPFYVKQKKWQGKYIEELPLGIQYYLLRQNIGMLNWYGNLNLPVNAVCKYFIVKGFGNYWKDFHSDISAENGIIKNNSYKGESYFEINPKNKVNKITWQANKIIVNVNQFHPDILVINQNYDKDWICDKGNVINKNGLLSVKLDNPRNKCFDVVFKYHPKSLYLGTIISIITMILCVYFFFIKIKLTSKGRII